MMKLVLIILVVGSFFISCNAEVFVVYGESNNIYVMSSTGKSTKSFQIQSSSIRGIAIHYEEDLIFAVDGRKIFKLFLLDDEGNPKKSGSGELFLNPKASHFESHLLVLSGAGIEPIRIGNEATSLTVDPRVNKLYICATNFVFEMDYDGKNVRKVIANAFGAPILATFYFSDLVFHGNKAYVRVYTSSPSQQKNMGIHETVIDPNGLKILSLLTSKTLILGKRISVMATDNTSNNIFYFENGYQIRLMQPEDVKQPSAPPKKEQVVLSNYGVTLSPNVLAVSGRNMFWSDSSGFSRQIWFGKLTKNKNFLPLENISLVTYARTHYQLAVFEAHLSAGDPFGIFNYWLVLMIGLLGLAFNLA